MNIRITIAAVLLSSLLSAAASAEISVRISEIPGRAVQYSSSAIAEIDGDTENGMEAAVATADGHLSVIRSDGSLLWSAALPNASCAQAGTMNRAFSGPAVGALHGGTTPFVVVGYGGVGGRGCDGGVIAFRGATGAEEWRFSISAFAKREKYWAFRTSVFSTPALADTDGDGTLEIGFGSFDRNVYLLNHDGSVRWYYNAADTVWSSAVFANVDSTPELEMIIGTDISQNTKIRPKTKNGGFVYAFKTAKRKRTRINFRDRSAYVWQRYLDQVVYSAPVVADVLPEHSGDEVIVGSGCYFPERSSDKRGRWVKILNLRTGAVLQTLESTGCSSASPAVGDIDNDGSPEIVMTVNGSKDIGGDGKSRLIAWKPTVPQPLWSVIMNPSRGHDSFGGHFQSAVIADIDGNGSHEIIAANGGEVLIFEGVTGEQVSCSSRPCETDKPLLATASTIKSTPAIGDIDGDGKLDIIIGSSAAGRGAIYTWSNFALGRNVGPQPPFSAPWPMYRGNPSRSGR